MEVSREEGTDEIGNSAVQINQTMQDEIMQGVESNSENGPEEKDKDGNGKKEQER